MKKVLSFVLSVAMVICLMPAMAFADGEDAAPTTTATATGLSQFSDADSIQNKEAVAVLVGLGIVDGMGDGTFQPAGNLTRAQASKLVATLVKSGDKSDIPAPAADPFTDVAKSYWGAGAIQFGVDNGYINGMGDGTFHPEDQVTAAQLATMLDKLLGYSVADINYQWPENAMAKATMSGLFDGVSKGANVALTRDDAAQMLYNALIADTVVKSTDTGSQGSVDGDTGYSLVPNTRFDYQNRANAPVNQLNGGAWEQLIEKYFPKVTFGTADSDDPFNRPVTVWKNGKTKVTDEVTKTPAVVYTSQEVSSDKPTEQASDQLKSDLEGYILSPDFSVFRNGVRIGVPGLANAQNSDEIANAISQRTGNGVLVEFYSDDRDVQIDRIVIADYTMSRVSKVSSKDKTIELAGCDKIDDKATFWSKISSVEQDEYVLAAIQGTKVIDAYIPTEAATASSITKITRATKVGLQDAKATIGSDEFTLSAHGVTPYRSDNGNIVEYKVDTNVTGSALTDQYGYLVGYRTDNESAKDWALLTSAFTKKPTNEYGEQSTEYYAQLVMEDGTIDTVKVLYDTDTNSNNYDPKTVQIVNNFIRDNGQFSLKGKLVTYDETADGYKFDDVDANSTPYEAPAVGLKSKDTKLNGVYISDSVSVVTVSGSKASKLEAKTSSKLKTVDDTNDYKYITKKSGNNTLVTTIYIFGDSDTTLIKVTADTGSAAYGSSQKAGRMIEYYTDDSSEVQTLVVSSTNNRPVNEGWYVVDEIKEGMNLTNANLADPTTDKFVPNHVVGRADAGYGDSMTIAGTAYDLDENLKIVDLDERGGVTDVESLVKEINAVAANPTGRERLEISFKYTIDGDKKVVKQVYIEENPAPAPAPTNDTQQGNENQQPGDNTQQGEQAQQGDDTQQGEQAQQGDDTQQGEQAQQGDDTQQGGGDEVAG